MLFLIDAWEEINQGFHTVHTVIWWLVVAYHTLTVPKQTVLMLQIGVLTINSQTHDSCCMQNML